MVVDASALADFWLRRANAAEVEGALGSARAGLHAPHLLDLEILQVLRRNLLAGRIREPQALTIRRLLARLPLHRHAHRWQEARIWDLRHVMTAYDACYVALAASLRCPLLTTDLRLARAAAAHVSLALPVL